MIRFAIFAGVSTDAQAQENKQSIPDQVENCRRYIAANGGVEAVSPYIMDGYSRTGYDSLDEACRKIPPLAQAVKDAQDNKYDVLIMDHFDRLGDIGLLALVRFKRLRKQLFSVRQSGKLADPATYNPYEDESADMQMRMHGIIQVYRINKIRRAWETGVPDRAAAGLHPLTIPFGYRLGARGAPAEPIPQETELIRQMMQMYLQGRTLQAICDHADASGIPPRRSRKWQRTVINRILHNPYYAGVVTFGMFRKVDGKRVQQPPSKWIRGNGQHIPLWDESTYYAILAERDRRDKLRSREQTYALTGLCECAKCGQRLHHHGTLPYTYVACRSASPAHISMRYETAKQIVFQEFVEDLQVIKLNPELKDKTAAIKDSIAKQQTLRRKVQEGYELELYTAVEAQKRISAAELEIEKLTRKLTAQKQHGAQRSAMLQFADQDPKYILEWLHTDDPKTVNHFLTTLCVKVLIQPKTLSATIIWRD